MIAARNRNGIQASRAPYRAEQGQGRRDRLRPGRKRCPGSIMFTVPDPKFIDGCFRSRAAQRVPIPMLSEFDSRAWPIFAVGDDPAVVPVSASAPDLAPNFAAVEPAPALVESEGARVSCDEERGILTVHDPRLFRIGREAFCRALVEQAVGPGGARKAEVCLGTSVMRLTFVPGRYRLAELAERAAAAIRSATALVGEPDDSCRINRRAWTSLTAIVTDEQTSIWETLIEKPGRVLLSHRALSETPWLAAMLAQALRNVPGVRGCRATSLGRTSGDRCRPGLRRHR